MALETTATIISDAAIQLGLVSSAIADPFASTDPNILQLISLLNSAGRELVRAHDWQVLRGVSHQITVIGDQDYDTLPDDFDRLLDSTTWQTTNLLPGVPIDATTGNYIDAGNVTVAGFSFMFRLLGNQILVYPTPTAIFEFSFEYISNAWTTNATDSSRTLAAGDTINFDPDLIGRLLKVKFKEAKGMDTAAARADYETYLALRKGSDVPSSVVEIGGPSEGPHLIDESNVPDGSWTT